jgi:hypothetical protein
MVMRFIVDVKSPAAQVHSNHSTCHLSMTIARNFATILVTFTEWELLDEHYS